MVEPPKKIHKGGRYRKILRSPSPEDRSDERRFVSAQTDGNEADFRKENYLQDMFSNFEKFKLNEKYCDVILRVVSTNTLFRAHTLILSSASTFFEELLQNPKHRDCKNIVLSLPEYIESGGLAPVIAFMYSGKIRIKASNVINIFKVAWLFKMDDILQMCRAFCHKYGFPQQQVSVASLHVILQKDKNVLMPLLQKKIDDASPPNKPLVISNYATPLQPAVKVAAANKSTAPPAPEPVQPAAKVVVANKSTVPPAPVSIPEKNPPTSAPNSALATPSAAAVAAASIKPSKDQKVSLTKQVFDHINNMCQNNAKNGKSSRVFFIKTGKPVDDIKSLVTSSLGLIRNINPPSVDITSVNEQPEQNPISISVNELTDADKTENGANEPENDGANVENNSESKCDYCALKSDEFIKGYFVHFFQPRFLLDANCRGGSRISDLNRHAQSFAHVSASHCVALVTIDSDITYSHPALYVIHALKKKMEETNEYPILWADVRHEHDCWRIVVTISEQFWVLERGEIRYAFLKSFQITPEVNERYKSVVTMRVPNEFRKNVNSKCQESDETGTERRKPTADIPRELKCEYCVLNFNSIAHKARHIYATHRQRMCKDNDCYKFICTECHDYKNRSLMALYFHQYRDHEWELSDLVKQFHCGLCCKIEPSLLSIKAHYERYHKSSRDYVCDKCGFAFKTASVLCSHVRNVHVKNFKNQCRICKKCFKDRSRLSIHTRIHTGEKPFKCDDCDYATAFRGNLKSHMSKKHSKQLPCLKPPDAYPRINTRGKARGRRIK